MTYKPTIVFDDRGYARVTEEGLRKGVSVVFVTNARNAGGQYELGWYNYPPRIVLHEIQGGAVKSVIERHAYPPHIWYDTLRRILFQTVPLGRSAYALYQDPNAPHYTNKAFALQVELSGYTEGVANEPIEVLNNIAEDVIVPLCVWVDTYTGNNIDLNDLPDYPWVIANSARVDAPQRYSIERWCNARGMLTHANVPMGDDHWDTGAMDIVWIANHAALCIGAILEGEDPFPTKESKMPVLVQTANGTIYAIYDDGKWVPIPGPVVDTYRELGAKITVLNQDWTQWSVNVGIIPAQ